MEGLGLGDDFTAPVVTTPNEIGSMTGKTWVLEPEGLGANPSSAISQHCGLVSKAPGLEVEVAVPVVTNTQRYCHILLTGCPSVVSYCVACGERPCSIGRIQGGWL